MSVRKLAQKIGVSKNTASYMISRLTTAEKRNDVLVLKLVAKLEKPSQDC